MGKTHLQLHTATQTLSWKSYNPDTQFAHAHPKHAVHAPSYSKMVDPKPRRASPPLTVVRKEDGTQAYLQFCFPPAPIRLQYLITPT